MKKLKDWYKLLKNLRREKVQEEELKYSGATKIGHKSWEKLGALGVPVADVQPPTEPKT